MIKVLVGYEAYLLGDTSTGESAVTLTIPPQVQITGVGDISFGTVTAAQMNAGVTVADDVCVFSNVASGSYTVKSTTTTFEVANGDDKVPFSVTFNDTTGGCGADYL